MPSRSLPRRHLSYEVESPLLREETQDLRSQHTRIREAREENQMNKKQIEAVCPSCGTTLVVDSMSGKVLRHAEPGEVDETGKMQLDPDRWESATDRTATRASDASDKFEEMLGDEKSKESRLDDLFDKAKKKVDERGKDEGPLG